MIAYDFDWSAVFGHRDLLRTALKNTLWIAAVSMVLATAFGLLLALLRTSRVAPLRWVATIYINVVRGIPLLVLIFYVYFGVSIWLGIKFTQLRGRRHLPDGVPHGLHGRDLPHRSDGGPGRTA